MKKQMNQPTAYFPIDRPHSPRVKNLAELHAARRIVKRRVKAQEVQLKDRLQELPGQLVYTGFKYVIPTLITGKITNSLLEGAKSMVDMFFIKKGEHKGTKDTLKKAGLMTALKWGIRLALRAI
jgi:hypothetical protein